MRILMLSSFYRWACSYGLTEGQIREATNEMNSGLLDAHLGSGLFKKRIGRLGQGKRAGFRVIVIFKKNERVIFIFGFSKNEAVNIDKSQLVKLRKLSAYYNDISSAGIDQLINNRNLVEVK